MSAAQNAYPTAYDAVFTHLPPSLTDADYIIVGGGTTGSIIAARLSDAYPTASILVIEAGPESFNLPAVIYPALYRQHISPTSATLKFQFAGPEPQLANRSLPMLTGKTLGGGSAVNLLMYARGQRTDFAGWEAEGWSADALVPFMKKSETYFGLGEDTTHGDKGPIAISSGKHVGSTLQKDFMASCNELGYPTVSDIQDLDTSNAVSSTYRIVSPDTGRRQDTAYTYLYPRLGQRSQLFVLVNTQVVRILFDEQKQANGVELRAKPTTACQTVKARKLIILSAGALGSPQILEMSGVGDSKVLEKAGVPVVSHLPGVGREYQNHHLITVSYKADLPPSENVDSAFNGVMNIAQLIQDDAEILSWNGVDASAKVRPNQAEIETFSPALRQLWDTQYANHPDRPFGVIVSYAGIMDISKSYPSEDRYFTLVCYNPYGRSRGYVHITGAGIDDPLDFRTGILSDLQETDVQVLIWLYKKQRQVALRMSCQRGQVSSGPVFSTDSTLLNDFETGSTHHLDPIYSEDDNKTIENWIRESVSTPFHSLGTCKMAPVSESGVVDNNLNVYCVGGLKVADLSIAPGNVSGNTMNTAVVIGEKAADIIIKGL